MPLIKPEYKTNLSQLESMEHDLLQSYRGSYVMHHVAIRAVGVFVVVFGACMAARYFGIIHSSTFDILGNSLVPVLLSSCGFWFMCRNRTWNDVLLDKLTVYTPINTVAYKNLQEEVKENNGLDGHGLRAFIEFEKRALFMPPKQNPKLGNFLSKNF